MPPTVTKPIRPGTVIRFVGEATPVIPPSAAETAAVLIWHDWGPAHRPVLVGSFPEFEALYGQGSTPGRKAVLGAFAGQALPGQGGAGGVQVYRMAAASAAPAKATVGGGLSLLAEYVGARGNLLRGIIEDDPGGDTNKQQFRLLLSNGQVERYNFNRATPSDLVSAINLRSGYVTAGLGVVSGASGSMTAQARSTGINSVAVDIVGASSPVSVDWGDDSEPVLGVLQSAVHTYAAAGNYDVVVAEPGTGGASITLAVVLPWPTPNPLTNDDKVLTGGDSGATLTIDDWEEATTALEYASFSVLAPFDVADPAIRTFLVSWVKAQDDANRPVMLVLGGPSDESVDDAIADAIAINYEHVVRLAGGFFQDDVLGANVSTSQIAPRVAGMLCALGDANSLTFKPMGGLTYIGQGFANDQIEAAILNGVTTLAQSSNPQAALRIERGLTTWVTKNDPTKPPDFFSDPRLVRLVDLFIRRMKEWGDNVMIGNTPVNDDSRAALKARARAEIDSLADRGLIIPGTDYLDVPVPNDPAYLDSLIYEFGFQCARTALYIFGFGKVR